MRTISWQSRVTRQQYRVRSSGADKRAVRGPLFAGRPFSGLSCCRRACPFWAGRRGLVRQRGRGPPIDPVRPVAVEDGRRIVEWANGIAQVIEFRHRSPAGRGCSSAMIRWSPRSTPSTAPRWLTATTATVSSPRPTSNSVDPQIRRSADPPIRPPSGWEQVSGRAAAAACAGRAQRNGVRATGRPSAKGRTKSCPMALDLRRAHLLMPVHSITPTRRVPLGRPAHGDTRRSGGRRGSGGLRAGGRGRPGRTGWRPAGDGTGQNPVFSRLVGAGGYNAVVL